jgi:hypothetical protein
VWQNQWAYVRLPFGFEGGLSASVYEAVEVSGRTDEFPTGYKPGRRLGYTPISPMGGSVLKATDGIIGMMGSRELGLQMYFGGANSTGEAWHPQGHERSAIAMGINPADLPDRWQGLRQFDAIVWGQGDPAELRGDRATAVREWVKRGGHLIIILPGVGQTWTNGNSNELFDIMPAVAVSRKEVEDLSGYRDLIMRRPQKAEDARPFPPSGVVHTFKPQPDAQPGEAMRILNNPEGECIVARRLVGAGVVTLIGLDLNQTAFSQFHTVDADVFWHRILGRRGSLEEPKATVNGRPNYLQMMNQRRPYLYDMDIPGEVSKTGQAAGGVLVGFVVFVLYWLLAGPVGFGLLKFRKWTQHAWVAFVLAAAAFTAVSWTGATMLRPADVEAKHLTFIDHVYGQPIQRARMWANLMIPWYGTARIAIAPGEDDSSGKHMVNAIAAWEPFVADASGAAGFPDVRGYEVDTKAPEVMVAPSRSTVKQIEADWAGGPVWEMPRPARPDEEHPGTGKLVLNDAPPTPGGTPLIDGVLTHNLKGPLLDVVVVVVRRLPTIAGGPIDMPIADAFKYSRWDPGTPLDLTVLTSRKPGDRTSFTSYAGLQKPTGGNDLNVGSSGQAPDASHKADRLTALAFFSQLDPPQLGDTVSQYAAQRMATHGWDLGVWFTHPCVIIVGHMDNLPSPVPLTVDGKPVKTEGTTYVRWVYPLPDNPPAYSNTGESQQFPHGAPTPEPAPEPPHEGGITNPSNTNPK